MIVVSSCLAGLEVRYNATHRLNDKLKQLVDEKKAVTVCPEVLGGLPTPREPAEIVGGDGAAVLDGRARILDRKGADVTAAYIEGAEKALDVVRKLDASLVVLKENSPSCGSSMIYNGEFSGVRFAGDGVTSALLKRHGYEVISEDDFMKRLEEL
ncbi:DUF523 domain-containing protein [Paenibacillus aquistagni]|uniref:Uncharacterized conserved protein YbbK, DUF523 family n=1 Tax=Paenibacillus aquistagni TaxID=1852522 RepID=A0A1X7IWR1_9BACL|nr:DUF523 domain-containing protein [Paenibacillus aquistagni]SMG19342.1 Uncharacterized conserved protein YbbK, DUF523 family [Paenibacillus aquistagni]